MNQYLSRPIDSHIEIKWIKECNQIKMKNFKKRLKDGEALRGCWLNLGSSTIYK